MPCRATAASRGPRRLAILAQADVVLAGGQHDAHRAEGVETARILEARLKARQAVEIAVVAVVAIDEAVNVEGTAHADRGVHGPRVPQRETHRVISAESAGYGHPRCRIARADQRKHFALLVAPYGAWRAARPDR